MISKKYGATYLKNQLQDAIAGDLGGRVRLGGDMVVREPVALARVRGLHVSGEGSHCPTIVWEGDGGDVDLFDCCQLKDTTFADFRVLVTGKLRSVFRHRANGRGANRITSTGHTRRNIVIEVAPGGSLQHGVFYDAQGDFERPNNEHGVDVGVRMIGVAHSGWKLDGRQSKAHRMRDCRVDGNEVTVHAVDAAGGSFNWDGGSVAGCLSYAYAIEAITDPITIRNADCDPSNGFLYAGGSLGRTGDAQVVLVEGGRFMMDAQRTHLAHVVRLETPGPVTFRGWQLGSGQQPNGKVLMDPGRGGRVHFEDVMFGVWGSREQLPIDVRNGSRFTAARCTVHDISGTPDWLDTPPLPSA